MTALYALQGVELDVWDSFVTRGEITPELTVNEIALLSDLHKVLIRGLSEPDPRPPRAAVLLYPVPLKLEPPTPQAPVAISGEFIPVAEYPTRIPDPARPAPLRIEAGATTEPQKYQNTDQLLRAAQLLLGGAADRKPVDAVAALEWIVAFDAIEMGL